MNRSKLRENIFKLLYTAEFQEKEEMPQQMSLYFTYSDDNDEDEEVTVSRKRSDLYGREIPSCDRAHPGNRRDAEPYFRGLENDPYGKK